MRALALTCLLLAGCGQAGDLYLPSPQPAPPETAAPPDSSTQGQAPAPEQPAPADKKDRK